MTAEALGVSVAPSFFQTCVTEGKIAKPEEVQKFKVRIFRLDNDFGFDAVDVGWILLQEWS